MSDKELKILLFLSYENFLVMHIHKVHGAVVTTFKACHIMTEQLIA